MQAAAPGLGSERRRRGDRSASVLQDGAVGLLFLQLRCGRLFLLVFPSRRVLSRKVEPCRCVPFGAWGQWR